MALLSEKFKASGVKVQTTVGGVPINGSGVIYTTPVYCDYNYIITAKHLFQEDSQTPLKLEILSSVNILYSKDGKLFPLETIRKKDVKDKLIAFDGDLAILIVTKSKEVNFNQFFVSETLEDDDKDFFAWGIFKANTTELQKFDFLRNDPEVKRFLAKGNNLSHEFLSGLSGAGIFHDKKPILFGIIGRFPNAEFQHSTIDCVNVSFSEINLKLKSLKRVELDCKASETKREIEGKLIDIHQALINGTMLDLEIARRRLRSDIEDDWFNDPLKFVDLLNKDYLFARLKNQFGEDLYRATLAEHFHVPKRQFTLRRAIIFPFIDRLLYMALVGVLADKLDKAMKPNVYAARFNSFSNDTLILNGVEQWKKMKHQLRDCAYSKDDNGNYRYGCVIEIDILNFYDNINKALLHRKILRVCETENDHAAAGFLHSFLKDLSENNSGLPQNSDASSLLASFYLNQVDAFMLYNAPAYYRFMDDVRIFCANKYEARKILQLFESELRRCSLSVNSQKTRIAEFAPENMAVNSAESNIILRSSYDVLFDFDLNKIARLRTSKNFANLNESFHSSLQILRTNIEMQDLNESNDSSRKLNYALNTIALLIKKKINLDEDRSTFEDVMATAISNLKDKPWITTQVCKVLNLVPTSKITPQFWQLLTEIVLDDRFNIYAFQTYQIWLLLAKHKYSTPQLTAFAVNSIERNDDTNVPVVAALVIYMSAIDVDYRRVILRKFQEGFTRKDFQRRSALIALRSFPASLIVSEQISTESSIVHEFTHRFKDKDLVFVEGSLEEDDLDDFSDQLYSM